MTLVTMLLCFLNPYTRLGGTELVYNLFAECHEGDSHEGLCANQTSEILPLITAIGIAMMVKGALTIVTFGIKVPAGIFIPTLGVGACFGRIVGLAVQYLHWERPSLGMFEACNDDRFFIIPGVYAMVCFFVAVDVMPWSLLSDIRWGQQPRFPGLLYAVLILPHLSALMCTFQRTTVSLAVIMFELTDTLTYVVPVMIGVLVARTVADAIQPKGIYDLCIEYVFEPAFFILQPLLILCRLAELPYLDGKTEHLWGGLQAGDAVCGILRLQSKAHLNILLL